MQCNSIKVLFQSLSHLVSTPVFSFSWICLFVCWFIYLFISVRRRKIMNGTIFHVKILILLSFCGSIISWKNKVKRIKWPEIFILVVPVWGKLTVICFFGPLTMKYHLPLFCVYFATHRAWQQAVISSVCVCARERERERGNTCLWNRVSHIHF